MAEYYVNYLSSFHINCRVLRRIIVLISNTAKLEDKLHEIETKKQATPTETKKVSEPIFQTLALFGYINTSHRITIYLSALY